MTTTIDAQAITIADIPDIDLSSNTPMTPEEARRAVNQINAGAIYIRGKLLEIHHRRGWEALGYDSWKEFAEGEFQAHRNTLYKMVEAAEVEIKLIEAGAEVPKILGTPDSQLRVIQQAPSVELQLQAFNLLQSWKEEEGSVTAKDAQAALITVDRNKRYKESEKLFSDYVANNNTPATPDSVLQWGQEKRGLTPRQANIIREDIEVFATNPSANQPNKSVSGVAMATPTATNGKAPTPQSQPVEEGKEEITKERAAQIAGVLNSYTPEELVTAMTYMDEEYKLQLLIHLAPIIEADMLAEFVDPSVAQAIADTFYLFGEKLDEVSA